MRNFDLLNKRRLMAYVGGYYHAEVRRALVMMGLPRETFAHKMRARQLRTLARNLTTDHGLPLNESGSVEMPVTVPCCICGSELGCLRFRGRTYCAKCVSFGIHLPIPRKRLEAYNV